MRRRENIVAYVILATLHFLSTVIEVRLRWTTNVYVDDFLLELTMNFPVDFYGSIMNAPIVIDQTVMSVVKFLKALSIQQ
jgi:hypothetical protein